MLTRMQQRRGTAAEWADSVISSTVILAAGEVGLETDTGKFKIGNGTSVWSALSYYLKDSDNAGIYVKLAPVGPSYSQNITGINVLTPQSSSQTPLVVSGISGQSAVLQRWRNNLDVTLASIDQTGKLTAAGALFNAVVNVNSNKITNLATPTADTDAATKAYVDATKQGLDIKDSVRGVLTGSAVTLTGLLTVDGLTTVAGNRILVNFNGGHVNNGIWVVAAGAWTRATDADVSADVTSGMYTFVSEGTAYADSGWVLTNNDPITLGTTALTFVQFSGAGQITAGAGLTKGTGATGNTIDAVGTTNRILVNADSIDISPNYVGQTTITTLGTVATGTWSATTIAANKGGTGQSTFTVGDLLYADTASTINKLASGTAGYPLLGGGAGVAPAYGQIATDALANSTSTTTGVTYAKLQYLSAQYRVLGRISASAGIAEELTPDNVITLIGQGTTTINFARIPASASGGNNGTALTVARSDHTHTINDLSDVVITGTPQTRQVIKYNGTNWVNEVPSGGISVGSTPPAQPAAGDAWFDSDDGALYVWYDDAVGSPSAQWVQVKSNSALEASILTRLSALESSFANNNDSINNLYKLNSGRYYGALGYLVGQTQTLSANRLFAQPIFIGNSVNLDRIGIEVTTAVASTNIRLLIYSDLNGLPNNLLLNAGVVDSSTTGVKELTITQFVSSGVYWLVCVSNGAPTVRAFNATLNNIAPTTFATVGTNGGYTIDAASGYNTPPTNFGNPTGVSFYPCRIQVRCA